MNTTAIISEVVNNITVCNLRTCVGPVYTTADCCFVFDEVTVRKLHYSSLFKGNTTTMTQRSIEYVVGSRFWSDIAADDAIDKFDLSINAAIYTTAIRWYLIALERLTCLVFYTN